MLSKRRLALNAAPALACAGAFVFTGSAQAAYATKPRVDLRVLVVTDGSATEDTIVAQLDREGIPYDTITASATGRSPITAATLSTTTDGLAEAKYQGIVLPNETALAADEMAVVSAYEKQFAVRQIDAYTWAG